MTTANPNGRVFWAGLLLILAAFTATAQEFRGSLSGKITDPNGAVVPGSKVEIKNIETGIVSSAMTDDDGAYSFPLLPPGKYALTVTKENFNTAVRDGIQVRVADRLTLDVQLEIGVTAMVTTVASGLTLDTGTVNTGTVVTGKQISELALAKGVRKGYLPASYMKTANDGFRGIQREFVKYDADGRFNLAGTVSVAGLGGNPYRDGSYEYYLSEKVITNDPKGIGAFLMAATEMEAAAKGNRVRGRRSQALQ